MLEGAKTALEEAEKQIHGYRLSDCSSRGSGPLRCLNQVTGYVPEEVYNGDGATRDERANDSFRLRGLQGRRVEGRTPR